MNYKLSDDFTTRYATAKKWRSLEQPYLEEILSFICPGRENDFTSSGPGINAVEEETFMSLPEEMATDFASDMVTFYTPSETNWTEYLVTLPVPEDQAKIVQEIVNAREEDLFDMIQASNYNDVAPQVTFELNHGTTAMWVQQGHLSQPIYVETVPPNELFIVPGYMGILDRFRETWVGASTLQALFADWDVDLTNNALKNKIAKPGAKVKVCWGFWLDWADPGNPVWRCEISADGKRITAKEPLTLGPFAGSCPLLVGRFNPQIGRPWGRGPARKTLPDMRVLNAVDEAVLNGLDQALLNTTIYPDDGTLDLSEGLDAGRSYAAGRGFTRDQVWQMEKGVNLDYGFLSEDRLEERIRSGFYQNGPRQTGDTPPTASQWIDQRRRVQQRIGKPSAPLWRELYLPFIQRVEHIGVTTNKIDAALTHNGDVISVLPISPLQKAQNQDKVMVTRSNLDLGAQAFGDAFPEVIDVVKTFVNIVESSGDELTVVKTQEEPPNDGTAPPPE